MGLAHPSSCGEGDYGARRPIGSSNQVMPPRANQVRKHIV
jgi:hypothetical protein